MPEPAVSGHRQSVRAGPHVPPRRVRLTRRRRHTASSAALRFIGGALDGPAHRPSTPEPSPLSLPTHLSLPRPLSTLLRPLGPFPDRRSRRGLDHPNPQLNEVTWWGRVVEPAKAE